MEITNNYSITQLFYSKKIKIFIDKKKSFDIVIPTLANLFEDTELNSVMFLWTRAITEAQPLYFKPLKTSLDMLTIMIFEGSQYKEYKKTSEMYKKILQKIIPDIEYNYKEKILLVNGLTITPDIWNHILYLLKLSCGEKVVQPPIFDSEEARKMYLAQQEAEARIRKVKAQGNQDKEGLIKNFLAITYAFPSLTFDYLFNQTMAQIQWLQKLAAGAQSYEVNAKAFAAGNVKKGKKLDFFIK